MVDVSPLFFRAETLPTGLPIYPGLAASILLSPIDGGG